MRPFTMVTSATFVAVLVAGVACARGEAIGPDTTAVSVRSVEVSPGSATLSVGESIQLSATVVLSDDRTGVVASWNSLNAAVATVNGSGVVHGEGAGTAYVVARSGLVSDTALVTVAAAPPPPPPPATVGSVVIDPRGASLQPGQTAQFTAIVRDAGGAVMNGRTAEWRVGNPGVASISATGLATATAAGTSYVIASADARADTVLLTVTAAPPPPPPPPAAVATVTVAPSSATLAIGATRQLTATMRDANGNVLTGRAVTWSTSSSGTASVSSSGLVTAVAAGGATITATSEGRSGTATITVSAPPPPPPPPPAAVATVTVAPATASITAGATQQLAVTLRDANNNVLTGRTVTWSSSATGVATVNGSGLVSGVSGGSATITATSEGRSGTALITVTVPPPSTRVDTIFYEGFESGSMSVWDDGYTPSQHRILTDAAGAAAGSRYLQVTNLQGADGLWLTKFFMPGYDSVYVRYYVKLASNWQSGTKLLAVYGNRTDNQWSGFGQAGVCSNGTNFFTSMVVTEPSGGNPPPMRFYTYHADLASTGSCYGEYGTGRASYTPDPFILTRGVWHKIEFWVKANTVGQTNGSQRYWVDGVLRADWSGIRFRTSNILRLNAVQLTFNQAFGSPQTQLLYVDDLLVTTAIPANR